MADRTPEVVIGHPAHSIFSMSPTLGQINGISEIFKSAEKIPVDRLVGFDLLPAGESIVFDAPASLQVVCFDSERSDMGWQDNMSIYAAYLEEGGSLEGPVVYRQLSDKQGAELKVKEEELNAWISRLKVTTAAAMAMASLVMSFFEGSLVPLVACAAFALFVIIFKKCSEVHDGKPKDITATKVAIHAPKKKVWVDS